MWKFKHDAPKGKRVTKGIYNSVTAGVTAINGEATPNWWSHTDNKWSVTPAPNSSSHCPNINSLRAFKKHLRKHPELEIDGFSVILVSRYYGSDENGKIIHDYNITAYWEPK